MGSKAPAEKNRGTQREYVPLYTRIKRLRRSAELSLWFWLVAPCVLIVLFRIHDHFWLLSSNWFANVAYAFIVGIFFIASLIGWRIWQSTYLAMSSYLFQTNMPMLIVDEQFWQQFHRGSNLGCIALGMNIVPPNSTLNQLILSSSHCKALQLHLTGNGTESAKLILDSGCLLLSGTWIGQALFGMLSYFTTYFVHFCPCGGGGWFLPVWAYHYFFLFSRQATLMAVCDYFLGTPQVKMHKLNNVGRYYVHSVAMEDQPGEVGLLPPKF